MKGFFNNFLLFFQFFTRVPINKNLDCDKSNFRKGSIFFPVIGLFLGAVAFMVFYFSIKVFSPSITAVLVLAVPIIITGGLHVDGLGDTCDGFFSFKGDKEKIMEVMKDSRVGTFASIAVIIDLLLRYTAVTTLLVMGNPFAIIVAPIISRLSVVFLAFIGNNAKENSSGNIFIGNIDVLRMIIVLFLAVAFTIWFVPPVKLLIIILSAMVVTLLFNVLCNKKIGGQTGDTLGANNEIIEIFTLLMLIALV